MLHIRSYIHYMDHIGSYMTIAISTYNFFHINHKIHVFAHRGTARFKRPVGIFGAPVNATTYNSTLSKNNFFGP